MLYFISNICTFKNKVGECNHRYVYITYFSSIHYHCHIYDNVGFPFSLSYMHGYLHMTVYFL